MERTWVLDWRELPGYKIMRDFVRKPGHTQREALQVAGSVLLSLPKEILELEHSGLLKEFTKLPSSFWAFSYLWSTIV